MSEASIFMGAFDQESQPFGYAHVLETFIEGFPDGPEICDECEICLRYDYEEVIFYLEVTNVDRNSKTYEMSVVMTSINGVDVENMPLFHTKIRYENSGWLNLRHEDEEVYEERFWSLRNYILPVLHSVVHKMIVSYTIEPFEPQTKKTEWTKDGQQRYLCFGQKQRLWIESDSRLSIGSVINGIDTLIKQ